MEIKINKEINVLISIKYGILVAFSYFIAILIIALIYMEPLKVYWPLISILYFIIATVVVYNVLPQSYIVNNNYIVIERSFGRVKELEFSKIIRIEKQNKKEIYKFVSKEGKIEYILNTSIFGIKNREYISKELNKYLT